MLRGDATWRPAVSLWLPEPQDGFPEAAVCLPSQFVFGEVSVKYLMFPDADSLYLQAFVNVISFGPKA